ncbi:hypothetical protein A3D72_01580 [Candidatus Uhrbacteria bacterium RIFCSPHIGHO2_02_FULL_57_19]|uniref:DNA 3'-5' helicase n=1 Tax=Candidatus Uhrbacteria bacterium RIFCSPHIGHO2_02_FULL_57_19 TaxID=1802391 RepID=A0A1F7U323_9BACT|nr:MAG: hypothetical protein A3D72_01580 [Candidatus Uhrbacteria bacterium RIFCSPHIGHO2_02_FULL_57_19]
MIDYKKELNPEQLDVVLHGDGPALVLAGAGSGKTRVVTYRVAYLLEQGVKPEEILLLTFTNKAANEMLSRVRSIVGTGDSRLGVWGGTFHAIGNRVLRSYADRLGFGRDFTILDNEDSRDLVKLCLKEALTDVESKRFPSAATIFDVISFARSARVPIEESLDRKYPRFLQFSGEIESIAAAYARRKRMANAMDFDDLLAFWLELLQTDAAVSDRLCSLFRYVLVDEYQDTNPLQAAITDHLASKHGNLLVVGDDAQSIYSFRAAAVENILTFPKRFPKAKIFKLETNYRSSPEILKLANAIISGNREQFKKNLRPVRPADVKPVVVAFSTAGEEAEHVARRILSLRQDGLALNDMAVLFRATHITQPLEMELMRRDIPYEYRGGMKFFERAHIKDILAFLRIRENPKDAMAWMRVLSLQEGIGEATAGKLLDRVRGISDAQKVLELDPVQILGTKAFRGWNTFLASYRPLTGMDLPAPMIRTLVEGPYKDHLIREHQDAESRIQDLEQFAIFAEGYKKLGDFLSEVALKDDYGAKRSAGATEDRERLILSTIHQSKGLEWDAVFVIHMVEGVFPNKRAAVEENGIEEERRLFYVAATRARRSLNLSYPTTAGYDILSIQNPSQFLDELNPKLIEARRPTAHGDEPVIELDRLGERSVGNHQYLRDVNEL